MSAASWVCHTQITRWLQVLVLGTGDMVMSRAAGIKESAAAASPYRNRAACRSHDPRTQQAQACKAAKEPLLCVSR